MEKELLTDARHRMDKAVDATKSEFNTVRSGRASTGLLDRINVDYYGARTPLQQLANIAAPEPRLLTVTPYDKSSMKVIEKAIRESDLGINPASDGQLIRLPVPHLTEERRRELVKMVHRLAEDGRVSVRNVRRDAMKDLRELVKEGMVGKDTEHRAEEKLQKITDDHIGEIEKLLVFPRVVMLPDFAGPSTQLVGESSPRQRIHAISTDSSSVRQYVPGDSESRIHWLTTARVDTLMVKQFDRGSASHVWVVFDMDAATVAGEGAESTDEYGATLAASTVDKYLRMTVPVGYAAFGSESLVAYPERGTHQRERVMHHLAAARPTGRTPLLDVLAGLEPRLSYNSSLVVITAAGDGEWTRALAGLGRRGVRVSVVLVDRLSFGGEGNGDAARSLLSGGVRTFSVRRDVPLYVSLSEPLGAVWLAAAPRAGGGSGTETAGAGVGADAGRPRGPT